MVYTEALEKLAAPVYLYFNLKYIYILSIYIYIYII